MQSDDEEMNASFEDGSASVHFECESSQHENELSEIIPAIAPLVVGGGRDMDVDMNVDIREASTSVSLA